MDTLATILSISSGFILMGHAGPPATVIATSLFVNVALAPLTAVISSRRDRSAALWFAIGLGFGMWALAAALLMGARARHRPSNRASTSGLPPDAA
ncbi:MAG: hypothetical protein ACREQF_07370 [Candidatus Binataceae bacterium]